MTCKYVSYLRVSTAKQGGTGLSIEAQRDAVSRYAASTGVSPLAEYVEVESGKKSDRPQLQKAIALCRKERAVLLIAKLDRLARNVAFVANLMESGVEFVAVDSPQATRLVIHVLSAFAEHEREMISARTKAALAVAKARGTRLGVNGYRLAESAREEALAAAQAMRPHFDNAIDSGCSTTREIAEWLNERGVASRESGHWHSGNVWRVLKRLGYLSPEIP